MGIVTVVLAGCLGGPADPSAGETPTGTPSSASGESTDVSGADVPGVSNGSLANATALAGANEAALAETGAELETTRAEGGEEISFDLRLGPEFSTYELSGTYPAGGQLVRVDVWTNETRRFVRMAGAEDVQYRVLRREDGLPSGLAPIESFLASGRFVVRNESTGDGTVVLTATESPPRATGGPAREFSSFDGRLVVDESGRIHDLTVSAVDEGRPVTYRYELRQAGHGRVPKPDWFQDVPESATLRPDLAVDVENDSYLAVRHRGGDAVPAGSTLAVTANETAGNATFGTELDSGETRYAYFHASDGTLRIAADRPDGDVVDPVTSPVSVSLATDDGVTLFSASMGWGSESASASEGGGSGGESGSSSREGGE